MNILCFYGGDIAELMGLAQPDPQTRKDEGNFLSVHKVGLRNKTIFSWILVVEECWKEFHIANVTIRVLTEVQLRGYEHSVEVVITRETN